MTLIDRIKNILITPKTEWPVIAGETTPNLDLVKSYVLPLAAIPAVAGFIGGSLIGHGVAFLGGTYRVPFMAGIGLAIFGFVMAIASVYIMAYIVNALAPTFGAEKSTTQAFKVVVYSSTAGWAGGVFQMIPGLGLLGLLASLYGIYILFLGLPRLMKCPEDKAIGYTAVVVIVNIVVFLILGTIVGVVGGIGGAATGMFSGRSQHAGKVAYDKDSPMGKLEALSKNMEAAGQKMDAAQKSGNPEEAMKAAMAGLGAAFSGGKTVEPLGLDQLKPFVPATFAGLDRKANSAEKTGAMGMMMSRAQARYAGEANKSIDLEISDAGGASGLMALASWAGVQGEKEDEYGSEKTAMVKGRLVHEMSRKDGSSEYTVVLGQRFVVSAKGQQVDLKTLKAAVSKLDLGKLESLKDVGVQK